MITCTLPAQVVATSPGGDKREPLCSAERQDEPVHSQSPWGDSTLGTAGSALECGEAEKCTSVLTTKDKQPISSAQSKRRAGRQHNVAEVFGTEDACRGLHL